MRRGRGWGVVSGVRCEWEVLVRVWMGAWGSQCGWVWVWVEIGVCVLGRVWIREVVRMRMFVYMYFCSIIK